MPMIRYAFLSALALVGCQEAPPNPKSDQFDLACPVDLFQSNAPERKTTKTFKVDLTAGLWCEDDCTSIEKVARVEPDTLRLTYDVEDEADGHVITVDRLSGQITGARQVGEFRRVYSGTCERKPFTGLPKTKF